MPIWLSCHLFLFTVSVGTEQFTFWRWQLELHCRAADNRNNARSVYFAKLICSPLLLAHSLSLSMEIWQKKYTTWPLHIAQQGVYLSKFYETDHVCHSFLPVFPFYSLLHFISSHIKHQPIVPKVVNCVTLTFSVSTDFTRIPLITTERKNTFLQTWHARIIIHSSYRHDKTLISLPGTCLLTSIPHPGKIARFFDLSCLI